MTTDTNPDAAAASQAQISEEIASIESDYQRGGRTDKPPFLRKFLREDEALPIRKTKLSLPKRQAKHVA